GTHHNKTCGGSAFDIKKIWHETSEFYTVNLKHLFPTSLQVNLHYQNKRPFINLNGGWGDLRDKQLCLSFAFKDEKVQKIKTSSIIQS
ncbi:unnamed protein product, partial [Didymodactylos carnosus]